IRDKLVTGVQTCALPIYLWRACKRRREGFFQATAATVTSVMIPPKMTEGAVPINLAATPDSKAPISLEEPMKIPFTAETRPRRRSEERRVGKEGRRPWET